MLICSDTWLNVARVKAESLHILHHPQLDVTRCVHFTGHPFEGKYHPNFPFPINLVYRLIRVPRFSASLNTAEPHQIVWHSTSRQAHTLQTPTMSGGNSESWSTKKYNEYYNSYVPWMEDKYLAWFGENKTSYVAKGIALSVTPTS